MISVICFYSYICDIVSSVFIIPKQYEQKLHLISKYDYKLIIMSLVKQKSSLHFQQLLYKIR